MVAMTIRPEHDRFALAELVGRHVVNAMGQEEIVFLTRAQWDYLDWLEAEGADVAHFITRCDLKRKDVPLSDALSWWVHWWFLDREKQGYPRPDWLEAPHPDDLDAD